MIRSLTSWIFWTCIWFSHPVDCLKSSSSCLQLGCDQAGSFTQHGFKLPIHENRTLAWMSHPMDASGMNDENRNYGCVGSSELIVCLHNVNGKSRHIMLDADTGEEYDTSGYETLENVNMPVLTEENLVFAVNGSHASLIDPFNNRSFIINLPYKNLQGVHSPVYLPDLEFFVMFGNLSLNHSIFKIVKDSVSGDAALELVTTFSVAKTGSDCPWLFVSEAAISGNRAYIFTFHVDNVDGSMIAVDFLPEAPFYRKAWEWEASATKHDTSFTSKEGSAECTLVPKEDPQLSIFPPLDLSIQMLSTQDGYVMITTAISLLVIRDKGDHGEQAGASMFGGHFLTLAAPSPVGSTKPIVTSAPPPPIVWITGWRQYPKFRKLLIAFNYTNLSPYSGESLWTVNLYEHFGVDDLNITSRITTFDDPANKQRKILVFGLSVNSTNPGSPFHTEYCSDCKPGVSNVLIAVRATADGTEKPDVVWIASVPFSTDAMEVKGQIFGVSSKLVMQIYNATSAYVVVYR